MQENEGLLKARAVAEKIKASTEVENSSESIKMAEVKTELALLKEKRLSTQNNAETQAFFARETNEVDEDLGGASLPVLRIHTNQSKNELINGQEPKIGNLFYTATKTEYSELIVHILKVVQCEILEYGSEDEYKNNYLIAGVIASTNEPFIFYAKGVGYNEVWDLQAQLKPFVKRKVQPIPKYALFVRLYTELKQPMDTKYKPQHAVKYEVLTEDGDPYVENLVSTLNFLKMSTDRAVDAIESIIAKNGRPKVVQLQAIEQEATPQQAAEAMGADPDSIVSQPEDPNGPTPF